MTRILTLVGLVCAVATLAATPALAGKPSGGSGGTTGTASVSASPNPAAAWGAHVDLSGCGYVPSVAAKVVVNHSAGSSQTFYVSMWGTGCMDTAYFLTAEPGTYTIQVLQTTGSKRNTTTTLMASTTLTVV